MTPDTMTKDEKSCLLYLESCAVDHGGLAEGQRMNGDDYQAAARFKEHGVAELHRIPAALLGKFLGSAKYTHWCSLTDAGFALAGALRQQRATRLGPYAKQVVEGLRELGKIAA